MKFALLCVLVDMDKQNKPNVVAAARFDVISKKIQRSIELATALSTSFTFSEPISIDPSLVSESISSDTPKFEFCEPLKQVKNEKTDAAENLIERMLLLNISDSEQSEDESNNQDHHSTQQENVDITLAADNSEHIDHSDVGKSPGIDPNTQITHLQIDNNKQNAPSQKHYDKQPLPFLIKHIHKITWANQDELCYVPVMEMFGQTFDVVIIYGIVTSLCVENGGLFQRFVIDDGSDSISVVWKANNHIIG